MSPFLLIVRRVVQFLQGLHAQCPAGAYRWVPGNPGDPDESESEIWIGSDNPISPQKIGLRPAYTVLRGPGSFQGVGLNDHAYTDLRTGATVKMDILPVTVVINVLSRFPVEADQLGFFVASHMWSLREELMRGEDGIMFIGQRPTIGPPSPAGSLVTPDTEHNWTVVSLSFPTYLQFSTTKMPLNKQPLSEVSVDATVTRPGSKPKAPVFLQGSALLQPKANGGFDGGNPMDPSRIPGALPQNLDNEGEYTEPVRVQIITKE